MCKIHWVKHLQVQPHDVVTGISLQCIGQKCLLLKARCLYSAAYFIMCYECLCSYTLCFQEHEAIWGRIREMIYNNNDPCIASVMKEGDCKPCAL